jgi:hypothetical protein
VLVNRGEIDADHPVLIEVRCLLAELTKENDPTRAHEILEPVISGDGKANPQLILEPDHPLIIRAREVLV